MSPEKNLELRVFDSLDDCVMILDADGHLEYLNKSARACFANNQVEPKLKSSWLRLWSSEFQSAATAANASAKTGKAHRFEAATTETKGLLQWWDVSLSPFAGSDDESTKLLLIARNITQRKRTEAELEAARERVETMLIAGEVGVWVYEIDKNWVIADQNLATLFGLTPEQVAGGPVQNYLGSVHSGDRARVKAKMTAALEKGDSYQTEYRVVQRDGSARHVIARGRIERSAKGIAVRLSGVILDITDRVLAQRAFQQSEQHFRQLADAMPQIVWAARPDGTLDYYNRRWFEYIAVSPDAGDAARWDRYIHPDDLQTTYDAWVASLGSGEPYEREFRVRRADGTYRWFLALALPIRNREGSIERWFGTCTDIHERQELKAKLVQSEALFRQLSDTITQLAWMARPDGAVFWYNRRWFEYTGTTPEQMEGWGWQSVHDPEVLSVVLEKWKASIESGEPFSMTFPIKGADGVFRPFLTRVNPLKDEAGQIAFWFGTNTDVSEQQQMVLEREALLVMEREARGTAEHASKMKDEFLATLSHELRTPLSAILGWTHIIGRKDIKAEDLQRGVESIDRNARVQAQLIEDLLDMSRIISGKVRLEVQSLMPQEFIEAAIETVAPAAGAKNIRIEKILDSLAGPISGDRNRLQQVVWNLLSNAIKFTPRGGKVQILLERVNSHLEIAISDTGLGIGGDFLPYVFDRFRQADSSSTRTQGGLGLGLAIVKQLVELHGGSVKVKSPGANLGSTFTVHLPLKITHADDMGPQDRAHPTIERATTREYLSANLKGLKVLVVDDQPDANELLQRVLQENGAFVFSALSATEGLSVLKREKPDVVVSDIGMPGMDGYEFIRSVRALSSDDGGRTPAIALTAFARTEDRTKALRAGYVAHIAKPADPSELVATVASVMGRTGLP